MEHAYRSGARQIAVRVQRSGPARFSLIVDGRQYEVEATLLNASTVQLIADGVVHTLPIARIGDAYHVAIGGEVYVLTATGAAAGGDNDHPVLAAPQIVAPMPGKILQVLVRAGQAVAAGDGLLILEAMKMEHRMTAEAPATVRAVHVADGQMVDAGAVLVELDY
jgi:biotin carboxyl carrier protein